MAIQIQLRHDTTANWEDENPTLAVGELGYNTTTNEFKIGDGDTPWSDLPYYSSAATDIKTRVWGYPSNNAVAVMPDVDGESIALKSSDAAAIRWHARNNGFSYGSDGNPDLVPTAATISPADGGGFWADFTFAEQDSIPYFGNDFHYNISVPESAGWDGLYYAISATTTTMRVLYEAEPEAFVALNATIGQPSVYAQFEVNQDGAFVKIANWSDGMGGTYSQVWQFTKEGAIHFPYGPSNSRTGYGDVLRFASSFDQAIITGPTPTEANPNANRLVVAGQDGYDGESYDGEGGDIYLWAGAGGGTTGDGGDIKIDGGQGQGTGQGGYVKIRGGYSSESNGGFVEITGGSSNTGTGGNISLTTYDGGNIIISGNGGEFLNSSAAENQIATQGYVTSALGTSSMLLATDNGNLTGELTQIGKLLYANLVQDTAYFAIPTNAVVAFPIGSEIKFATSGESIWQIAAIDTETTTLIGEGSGGYTGVNYNFIVPPNATATLIKVEAERWILSGLRLTD